MQRPLLGVTSAAVLISAGANILAKDEDGKTAEGGQRPLEMTA